MTPARKKRLLLVALMVAGVGVAVALVLQALDDSIMFFRTPSEVRAGNAPEDRLFRVGGMVVAGSIARPGDGLTVRFDIADNTDKMTVHYRGILPDLFREGQGIIANGRLDANGEFHAQEVLAKHDENYMPPELAGMHQGGQMPQ